MTELGGATHIVPDTGGGPASSIGPPLPGAQARVIDCASGLDAGSGQPGEMLIRTPGAMRGYLGNPEATAATIDADGWLHTGDVVIADREGWFQVVDRVKELIKYKGSQVAPAALEAILLDHPAVADAAVIGLPDEEAGEIPTAIIVLAPPSAAVELMSYVAGRVAPHEKIRRVEFVTEIPRSPSGKILRRQLTGRGQAAAPSRRPRRRGNRDEPPAAGPPAGPPPGRPGRPAAAQLGGMVSVITGGGRGIGPVLAQALAGAGVAVGLIARPAPTRRDRAAGGGLRRDRGGGPRRRHGRAGRSRCHRRALPAARAGRSAGQQRGRRRPGR